MTRPGKNTTTLSWSLVMGAVLCAGTVGLVLTSAPGALWAEENTHVHNEDVLYQCPMHPQIVSTEAGRCPLCKMFLKPRKKAEALQKRQAWETKTGHTAPAIAGPPPAAAPKKAPPRPRPAPAPAHPTPAEKAAPAADYTCPMHPHVSKPEFMRCPVCGMHLVPRDRLQSHSEDVADHDTFVCPMHPEVVMDEPGRCPICGMDLARKETSSSSSSSSSPGATPPPRPGKVAHGEVRIDPVVVQNMGVRIAPARREPLFRHIRALGTVDVAEDEIAVVNLRFSGWVEKLYVDETGVKVKAGQCLAEVYSPELVSAQEEYLLALRTGGAAGPLGKSARRRLEYFGMGASDIEKLDETKQTLRTIRVRAPREGYVLQKNIVVGARVMAGQDIFRIGNLQKIWINAEVYEFDAPWVEKGAPATMELTYQQGKVYSGEVAYIYPTLNEKSRTLTVRLEFDNPGLALKPGMFATVRIEARRREGALAIPTAAILHSGQRQLVFVAQGGGRYQQREVVTGLVADRHLTEVESGLEEGERVVVSGQFLLDSESQLQEAVQKFLATKLEADDPEMAKAESDHDQDGQSYWTCPMHPQIVRDAAGSCPICGMDLVEKVR